MTDYKQLCAELLSELENAIRVIHAEDGTRNIGGAYAVINKVKNTLAEPEPEEPTDEELRELWNEGWDTSEEHGAFKFARAILARWGNHPANPDSSLQPIPVSERLPEPVPVSERPWEREEWCDEQGRCWWFNPADPVWVFDHPGYCPNSGAFLLPAHALPLPTHD